MSNHQKLCEQYTKFVVDQMTMDELRKFVYDELFAFYADDPDLLATSMKNRNLTEEDLDGLVDLDEN